MTDQKQTVFLCSCEDTMKVDAGTVRRGCRDAKVETARQLCRAELARFRAGLASGAPLIVGCTQESPLFSEVNADSNTQTKLSFVNLRETAGWSSQANEAGPKIVALIAAAAEPTPAVPMVTLNSDGVIMIYGRDAQVIEAADLLKDHLDV